LSQKLKGKTAVITGASKGLGKSMSAALAAAGAKIALVARDAGRLEEVASEIRGNGGDAHAFAADVTQEDRVRELEQSVTQRFGRISILINNAGMNLRKPITDFSLDEWRTVIDTNVTSTFLMCRAFVPQMKGAGYGRIINMTSIMGKVSLPGRTAYSASKAALAGMTRALALELAPEGITANGICPGPFATEMNRVVFENPEANTQFLASLPVGRWGRVEEIGQLAVYLCSEDAGFITGTEIVIDGGWIAR
jgi:NAD(P)-dependent dehydrogenase (short-subunit alcohol dehydrogenase family)